MAAGLDSISATELTGALSELVGLDLPSTLLFDHPSIAAVASYITSATGVSPAVASGHSEGNLPPVFSSEVRITGRSRDADDSAAAASSIVIEIVNEFVDGSVD